MNEDGASGSDETDDDEPTQESSSEDVGKSAEINNDAVETLETNTTNESSQEKPHQVTSLGEDELLIFAETWSHDVMAAAQRKDPDISLIYEAKVARNDRPKASVIGGVSEATKAYIHEWRRLHINANGVLYRLFESDDGKHTHQQILLPEEFRNEMCKQFHDNASAGHAGKRKTIKQLSKRFYWHKMGEDVHWWIQTCEVCQKRKCPHAWPRAPMQQFLSGMPNERVAMDIVDHLQITHDGNVCILTITDHFTKYVKAIPLPNQTAETVASAFFSAWVAPFGAPHSLHTDQGSNFTSNLISELCDLLNIYKTRTTPYHPAGNGQVERYNRTMMDLIHHEVRDNPMRWDRSLPIACMATILQYTQPLDSNRIYYGLGEIFIFQ